MIMHSILLAPLEVAYANEASVQAFRHPSEAVLRLYCIEPSFKCFNDCRSTSVEPPKQWKPRFIALALQVLEAPSILALKLARLEGCLPKVCIFFLLVP